MALRIESLPTLRLAALHHKGPYHEIGPIFDSVVEKMNGAGLMREDTWLIGIYHDDPTKTAPEDLNSDACATLPSNHIVPMGMQELDVHEGTWAIYPYVGPISGIQQAWHQAYAEFGQAGYEHGAISPMEIYKSMSQDPFEIDIAIPIAPKAD